MADGPCPEDGQFPDNGYCYSCPSGYDRTAAAVTADDACHKWHEPNGPMKVRGDLPANWTCPFGQWPWPFTRKCYSCDDGWLSKPFVSPTDPNVCWQPGKFITATAQKHDAFCGAAEGDRACNVWEAIRSCGDNLYERNAKCEKLPPEKSAVAMSMEMWSKDLEEKIKGTSRSATEQCIASFQNTRFPEFPLLKGAMKPIETATNDLPDQVKKRIQKDAKCYTSDGFENFTMGFTCSVPSMLNEFSNSTEMFSRFIAAFDESPCTTYRDANAPQLQTMCAAAQGLGIESAVDLARCAINAMPESANEPEESIAKYCRSRGELAFMVAKTIALKKLGSQLEGGNSVEKYAKVLLDIYGVLGKATTLETIKDKLAKTPGCESLNDPAHTFADTPLPKIPAKTAQLLRYPPPTPVSYAPIATGDNSMLSINNGNACLSIVNGNPANPKAVKCEDGEPQAWIATRRDDGSFTFRNQQTWRCLSSPASPAAGMQPAQGICDVRDPLQKWSMIPASGHPGNVVIRPFTNRGLCMDVAGTNVQLAGCDHEQSDMRWALSSYGSLEVIELKYLQDGRCLAQGGGFDQGRQVFQWTCGSGDDKSNWAWMREPVPGKEGVYYLRSMTSDMCLDLSGGSAANSTPIQQWTCSKNNVNQQWIFAGGNSGYIQLRSQAHTESNHCVTLNGDGKGNNVVFHLWPCSGVEETGQYASNDKFTINWMRSGINVPLLPISVEWTAANARSKDIGIGGGKVWTMGDDGQAYRWNGMSPQRMGGQNLQSIDVDHDGNAGG